MMGRPQACLGDSIEAIEDAFASRYGMPVGEGKLMHPDGTKLLYSDGTLDLKEDCAGERTIEISIGPMEPSTEQNGSPHQAVDQIIEIVLKQNLDLQDPNDVGEEAAAAGRRMARKNFLNFVGDVVGFCRFLSVEGMREFGAVRYVQGGPIDLGDEATKELQWYIELALPLSLAFLDDLPGPASAAQVILRFGTYTGPVPASSITFDYTVDDMDLPDERQVVTG